MKTLSHAVAAVNQFYRLAARPNEGRYKEWFHFCVVSGDLHLIVNFSIVEEADGQRARVIVLARSDKWHGSVYAPPPQDVRLERAGVDLTMGDNRLHFDGQDFHIAINLNEDDIALRLKARPRCAPLRSLGARIGAGTFNWAVIPALLTSGSARIGGRLHALQNAPTYHDHNWGHWRWGDNFSWQWAFGLFGETNIVYSRMSDRARIVDRDRKLCLWRGGLLSRVFREDEVTIRTEGHLRLREVPKFPPVMSLLAPGSATDTPARLTVSAASGADRVTLTFESEDVAVIAIPNETDLRSTLINEVVGRARMESELGGERLSAEGRGVFELVHRE